jgi:NADPH:quinone reductase-like Zn-dependent oxidoreductase
MMKAAVHHKYGSPGAVGSAAVQLAVHFGATVTAVVEGSAR